LAGTGVDRRMSDSRVGVVEAELDHLELGQINETRPHHLDHPGLKHLSPLGWEHVNLTGDYI